MERLMFSTIPLILSILVVLLTKKLRNLHRSSATQLPPGPWRLPIIGSMHHLFGGHPHRKLHNLSKIYGPLLHLQVGEIDLIAISSAELACQVLKTHDTQFASRPQLFTSKIISYNSSGIVFSPYGKYWSVIRRICTVNLLSNKRIKSFSFIREEEGNSLVEKIRAAAGSPVNLSEMLQSSAYTTFARASFGKECDHQQEFLMAMKETFKLSSGFSIVDVFPSIAGLTCNVSGLRSRVQRVHHTLDAILNEIIEEHQANTKLEGLDEDLVDVLLRLKRDGELDASITMDNLKAVILDLFLAGIETASATLVWAMTELIRHPEIMQKAQLEVRKALKGKTKVEESDTNNLYYLAMVINETLRLRTAVPFLLRRPLHETVELCGYKIPAGSRILINAWSIMREPTFWDEPESFMPERFEVNGLDYKDANNNYVPFGGGRRICPGISFAMAGMECVLANLLFHFDWELPGGRKPQELDVEEAFGLTLTKKNDLLLLAIPHK